MNPIPILLTLALLTSAHADNATPNGQARVDPFAGPAPAAANDTPSNVQIDVEYVEIAEPVITALLHGEEAPRTGADWRKAIEKLVKESKGKVTGSISITTKSGQRASAESVKELTYATEFDPAKGRAANAPNAPKSITGTDVPTPTAFEMRPVGIRLEVEPTVSPDGKIIDLNIAPEVTEKVDEIVHQQVPLGANEVLATIKQPAFHTMKATTSVTVADGSSVLAAVLIPHAEKGDNDNTRRILCLVSARLVRL